ESAAVLSANLTNWCVVAWPTAEWAALIFPDLEPEQAMSALIGDLVYMLRLDEDDPAASWQARFAELEDVGRRIREANLDAIRFEGPGTDLTIGLLPSPRFLTV